MLGTDPDQPAATQYGWLLTNSVFIIKDILFQQYTTPYIWYNKQRKLIDKALVNALGNTIVSCIVMIIRLIDNKRV